MTAGNQVRINRDFGPAALEADRDFDPRIWDGSLDMPSLPMANAADPEFEVVSWREVALP